MGCHGGIAPADLPVDDRGDPVRAEGEKPRSEIINADCVEYLRTLPENSVDSVVTDPPYELAFMGRKWDSTGIAFQVSTWAEVFRVLKPGGHLLAFGGTRTYHRLACAVEDAGFEIRDEIQWIYSTGFPKSLNVSKAADRAAGSDRTVTGTKERTGPDFSDDQFKEQGSMMLSMTPAPRRPILVTAPGSLEGWATDGLGTALKPAHEPILVARKPLIGTVAENVLKHGTGALNVEASRVGSPAGKPRGGVHPNRGKFPGWPVDDNLVPAPDPSPAGRWPPNLLLTHPPECRPNGTRSVKHHLVEHGPDQYPGEIFTNGSRGLGDVEENLESWACAPGCPVAEMDRQSGVLTSGKAPNGLIRNANDGTYVYGSGRGLNPEGGPVGSVIGDSGGASRFFPTFSWHTEEVSFIYCPKAPRAEREAGLESLGKRKLAYLTGPMGTEEPWQPVDERTGKQRERFSSTVANHHPTVKPIAMLRWLVRLVTPPGGLVLDPFAGSGSTGCAAAIEGFRFLGIEKEAEYIEIAKRRIAYWEGVPKSQAPGGLLADSRAPSITLDSFA
jgi:DNA modification methylase